MRRPFSLHPCDCGRCWGWMLLHNGRKILNCREDEKDLADAVDILNGVSMASETMTGRAIARQVCETVGQGKPILKRRRI